MKIKIKKKDLVRKEPIDWKRLFKVYVAFLIFAFIFEFVLHLLPVELYRIKELAIADIDFTDIHYQYENSEDTLKSKRVFLINSGSLERGATFRPELTQLIGKLAAAGPEKIGLDHFFVDRYPNDHGAARDLETAIIKNNVVFGVDGQYPTIFTTAPKKLQGYINLPHKDQESVRTYFNYYPLPQPGSENDKTKVNSFARAVLSEKLNEDRDAIFQLQFVSKASGFYNALDDKAVASQKNDFPALEAADIINGKISQTQLSQLVFGKIVLIGHLGKGVMQHPEDITDKHRVPVDFHLFNRLPTMPGVVIHANAIQMLADNDRLVDVSGFWYFLIVGILAFFFLLMLMVIRKIKPILLELIVEVIFLIGSILGIIALSVALMDFGIHFHTGKLLLALALMIEFKVFAFHYYDHLDHKHAKKHKKHH